MKIAMGCDHGGIHLKEHIKKYLTGKGIEVVDHGTYTEDSCDYPDYAAKLCKDITSGESGAEREFQFVVLALVFLLLLTSAKEFVLHCVQMYSLQK